MKLKLNIDPMTQKLREMEVKVIKEAGEQFLKENPDADPEKVYFVVSAHGVPVFYKEKPEYIKAIEAYKQEMDDYIDSQLAKLYHEVK